MEDLWTEAVTVPNDNTHIFGDQTDVVRIANVAAYKGEVFFIGIIPLEDIKHRQSEKNQSRFPRKADNLGESNSALHTEPSNEEDNATLPLEFVAYTVQCLSWNEEKGWKPDCEALIFAENITCSCPSINRITSISYSNVPIDTIDLRSYARADGVEQDDNYVIAFLVMMLLAAFLPLSAWGHQWDCGDEPRFGLTSLPDNKPEHRHEYLVAVYTGRMPGSGTTSSLAMQLQGALGASDVHVLDGVWRDILRTGGRDWFSLRTAAPLGELQQLRLFHGHAGARPTWYCDRVMVLEPSPPPIPAAPRCYFFLVRRWFSPATAGCSVPRAPSRRLHALLPRFSRALERQFDNGYHSWFGMFHSHPESNFTRYQRICAAMMQLSLFLIVSMEMQKLLVNDDPTSSAGSYGNYALQWTDIFGGFVAAVFTFVAHCILAELYRRTASGNRHRFSTIVYQELGQSAASPTASPDYVTFRRLPSGTGNPAETREEATSLSTSVTTKDYSFPIPYKFLYLWWSITYAVITICFFVATSNSVTYSWVASLKLLTSFFVSFIISVFVLEPIRLLTVSIFCTFWDRNIRIDDRRYFPKEMTWKEKKAAETSKSSSVNVTLSLVKLKLLHRNNKMEIKFLRFLSEFFLYVAVIVMILIMVDQIEEYKPHTRIGSTTPEFRNIPKSYTRNEQISSQGQFMEYIQGTLLPEMYGTAGVGSLFGVPRLKQIRSDR
ncbi:polycystin-1-like protein 2 [Bacillus rossius redtenbacheri]|uniref:polycystin-1-like protein 2 n=1 Tax=Bacillus rossius redtenbacheri TaxID=93214 RepID=UPI002FDDE14E